MLRYWRQLRSKSQMDLALDIDISTRHLSFVETGKSRPGRDLLLKLADALRIPLRQRNLLLQLAGYSDEYREEALDSSRMAALQSATTRILENHEPFPALVINASYDILQVNNGAQKMLSYFMKGARAELLSNALLALFDSEGLQPFVQDWPLVEAFMIRRIRDEATRTLNAPLFDLLEQIDRGNRVESVDTLEAQKDLPMMDLHLIREDVSLRLFGMITTVGTPMDVAAQEIRIETFFPVDDLTADWFRP